MTIADPDLHKVASGDGEGRRYVFLSYAHQDRDLAVRFRHELVARGVNVWLDEDQLRAGSLIVQELEAAIEGSGAFVVLVTSAALSSGWVREEYGRALTLSIKAAYPLPIIPIAVEGVSVPGFLANRRVIALRDRSSVGPAVNALFAVLPALTVTTAARQPTSRIRFHSRAKGFRNGDVSVLAIAETLVAMMGTVLIVAKSHSLGFLAVSAFLAPFSLLQTDRSRTLGIRWLRSTQWWTVFKRNADNESRIPGLFRVAYLIIFVGLWFLNVFDLGTLLTGSAVLLVLSVTTIPLAIRTVTISLVSLRHPFEAIGAVSLNWEEIVLRKDLLDEPEIVPGYLEGVATGELTNDLRIPAFIRGLARPPLQQPGLCDCGTAFSLHASMIVVFALPAAIALYLPFYATRLALKSTAIFWAPLLWIAYALRGSQLPLMVRLRLLVDDAANKTIYVFSWLLLAVALLAPSWNVGVTLCLVSVCIVTIGLYVLSSRLLILLPYRQLNERSLEQWLRRLIVTQRFAAVLLLIVWGMTLAGL